MWASEEPDGDEVRGMDLLTTVTAGALGALVTTLLLGASLLLVIPAALGVGVVGIVADRARRRRG